MADHNHMVAELKREISSLLKQIVKETIGEDAEVKEEQSEAVFQLFQGRDVTVVLPTSYGKSLCMFAITSLHRFLSGIKPHKLKATENPQVLIITPLVSLMQAHAESARASGLHAVHLPEEENTEDADILLASPEFWTGKDGLAIINKNKDRIVVVATDEVHVVPRWGYSKDKQAAFRAAFSKLNDLRSHLPGVPYLALTATATKASVRIFQRNLGMKNVHLIFKPPTRNNIKISVKRVLNFDFLHSILEEFKEKQELFQRTIIYCKTTNECAQLFRMIDMEISNATLYAMYFHETLEHTKKKIVKDLMTVNGKIRIVVATNALGMGLNLVDCNNIIHYGVPRTVEDYTQEIGRAGRAGGQAEAILYYKSVHLIGCSDEMKEFLKNNDKCRRKLLLQYFTARQDNNSDIKECCDICNKDLTDISLVEAKQSQVRDVTEKDIELLTSVLVQLQKDTASGSHTFGAPIYSPNLTAAVCEHAPFIDGLAYVIEHLPIVQAELAVEVYKAFCEVFDETPDETDINYAREALLDWDSPLSVLLSSTNEDNFELPIDDMDMDDYSEDD